MNLSPFQQRLAKRLADERDKNRLVIRFRGKQIYPGNDRADFVAELIGKKTFSPAHLEILQAMGYEIEVLATIDENTVNLNACDTEP